MKNKEETFTRLYRYLLRPDIYYIAYKNLYANNGAATKGIDNDTADGFSETKITEIITALKNETYQPKAVRRIYIEKTNSKKKRPLGIPTFTDKLVQEALRMILEAVYEPVFSDCSHGFRPNKSCHTALKTIQHGFNGSRWFIEGDIKSCFDSFNHETLIILVAQKIKDARIIKLLYKFLKAGYMQDWQYHKTYSGTPQGGIISPLLANIYLHQLDNYISKTLIPKFNHPAERKFTQQYSTIRNQLHKIKRYIKKSSGTERQNYIKEYKQTRAMLLKTPSKSQTDKKIKYVRFADDFLLGICGSQTDCVMIKSKLSEFIHNILKMELSSEKTLITHSSQQARFLGYNIRVRRDSTIRPGGENHCTKRTLMNMVELSVPLLDKVQPFILSRGIAKMKNSVLIPVLRRALMDSTDLEILSTYNAELRGICNFYGCAGNFHRLCYFAYLMEYSCLKTLAAKHRSSIGKIKDKYRNGKNGWGIPYETKTGIKRMYFAKFRDCKNTETFSDVETNAFMMYNSSVTTFESRLKAKVCELCNTSSCGHFELHHINKVKNLKGKDFWERVMIAKRRKTLVLCKECHYMVHHQ
ncbi:MAG: reverse transcriptase domain-containing protein [Candidatus Bathyarchaeota archaeon]|nr:reverse transcriptase domain-containing protein [Candidatus Termitimicrobium sp.]